MGRDDALIVVIFLFALMAPAVAATPDGPSKWANPDVPPWGVRRRVMPIDVSRVQFYRSGRAKPVYESTFTNPAELQSNWNLLSDDPSGSQSCRRPENISVSAHGLKLTTKMATDSKKRWSTGSMISKFRQKYGFFEATIKIPDSSGLNNAFWLTTDDNFEIDNCEIHYPHRVNTSLHNWNDYSQHYRKGDITAVGFSQIFKDDFSMGYHDFGALWTGNVVVFEVDGQPINAIITKGQIHGAAQVRFSTGLMQYAGKVPEHPENHAMEVKSLRVFAIAPEAN